MRQYNKFFNYDTTSNKVKQHTHVLPPNPSPPHEPTDGVVFNCKKLNLRKRPDKMSEVICVISEGDQLQVERVDAEWAHVYTSAGIDGYAMASFINLVK